MITTANSIIKLMNSSAGARAPLQVRLIVEKSIWNKYSFSKKKMTGANAYLNTEKSAKTSL